MKRVIAYLLITIFAFSWYATRPVLAQSATPPTGPVGEVRGTIINRNSGKVVTESLDVMLHVLDQDLRSALKYHPDFKPALTQLQQLSVP